MRLEFLADALDHWKGSLLADLQAAGLLRNLAVDPMASDPNRWTEPDWVLFAGLLRIPRQALVAHRATLQSRREYFAELPRRGDLFLDPDTGVLTGATTAPRERYLYPTDLGDLLALGESRVIAVYQHIRAQAPRKRLNNVVGSLRPVSKNATFCSYESSTVAMLFASFARERVDAIADHLASRLGRHAGRRVGRWRA